MGVFLLRTQKICCNVIYDFVILNKKRCVKKMTEELINLLESVVVGLLTGIVTGVIVTKYYRKKMRQ